MAKENATIEISPIANGVAEVALEFMKHRNSNGSAEQLAIRCFRDATAFLKIADKFATGVLSIEAIDNDPLDEAHAPNLKKTHPVNLVSRRFGSVAKVAEIWQMIKNPDVVKLEELNWGLQECNQARAIFPAVLEKVQSLKVPMTSNN